MAAESKLELILEMRNKMKAGLSRAKEQVGGAVREMKQELSSFKHSSGEAFDALRNEVPFLGQFTELMKNPWALAAAAVVAFTALLASATLKAADFNNEFLNIRQLNLDKSKSELTEYRELVLDTAYRTGLAAKDMSVSFYDIQSGTGLFGEDVRSMAEQVGIFSKATKAELGPSVNSAIKAMKTFGFGVEDVTAYLESNAKTVQVGITTFNDLAQVQTEFAGAAKAAGQDFNTANKLFAAFTASAKDSATAATLTKSAFQGLTTKPTIDGLAKIGINMFDADKNMRNLDGIIEELIPKIKTMSDEQFLDFRNAIGGPEGLQNLFNSLRTSGDDVLATMKAFDRSAFSLDDAVRNAKEDFIIMREELANKINVLWIKLGNEILPVVSIALRYIIGLVDRMKDQWEGLKPTIELISKTGMIAWAPLITAVVVVVETLAFLFEHIGNTIKRATNFLKFLWEGVKSLFTLVGNGIQSVFQLLGGKGDLWESIFGTVDKWAFKIKTFFGDLMEFASLTWKMMDAGSNMDFKTARQYLDQLRAFKFRDSDTLYVQHLSARKQEQAASDSASTNTAPTGSTTDFAGGATSLETSSGPVRNITVNIDSFVREMTVRKESVNSMSETDLDNWFRDMIMRNLRNAELSAG